jgi:hypothetical protein
MKRALTTTALLTVLLTSGAMAQSDIVPPEGYTVYETALTTELLRGANVYDSTGEVVGEIHDLVLGATGGLAGEVATAPATEGMTDGAATDSTATDGAAAPASTDGTTAADTATASDGTTGDTATDATAGDTTAGDTSAGDTVSGDVATGDGTTTEGAEMTGTGLSPDGTTASDPATTEGSDTAAADVPAEGASESMADGEVTHAILDVGGFLGMGEHRIAVPVSDLQLYRGSGDDVRIYLPWTREQLEAQSAYEEGNLSTLGQPMTSP